MSTSGTDVKMAVRVKTRINKMCDKENDRYALSNVLVTKGLNNGELFLAATDGQALAVASGDGTTDMPHLIPSKAFHPVSEQTVQLNGAIEVISGKKGKIKHTVHEAIKQGEGGMYPNVTHVLEPMKQAEIYEQVVIDVELLLNLAMAINSESNDQRTGVVTLFVPKAMTRYDEKKGETVFDHYPEGCAIKVLGNSGAGLLMPLDGACEGKIEKFNWFANAYKYEFGQAWESIQPPKDENVSE